MELNTKKTKLPHIVAIFSFLIISFVYFSPVFDGKELVGHDTQSFKGMSKEILDYNENNDDAAKWTNSMFGGMPTYQISCQRPSTVISWVYKVLLTFPRVVITLFLYLIGFYILLLSFKVNPWLSLVCSIGFAFGSYNFIILSVGHDTKAMAIALMAPLVGSIVMAFRWKRWLGAALTALFLGIAIQANHLQISYYTLIILLFFGAFEFVYAIYEKRVKQMLITLAILLGSATIAIGLDATNLLTTYEYSQYTMRGKSNGLTIDKSSSQEGLSPEYITQFSYGIKETMTLLIPNFMGGPTQSKLSNTSVTANKLRENGVDDVENIMANTPMPTYWGTQPIMSGPVYVGAIICFLFVLGIFLVEGKNKWWILGATILSILLAWGKNFMPFTEFFINHVPLYNMFRAVSMTLVITAFCMALMASLALKEFINPDIDKKRKIKALYISAGIVGGITLLFSLIPQLAGDFKGASDSMLISYGYPDFITDTLPLDRKALLRSDALHSLLFIALSGFVLWLYLVKNLKLKLLFAALGILFLVDMAPIAKRYLNNDNFTEKREGLYFTPTPADKYILQDHNNFRVLDMTVDIFNSSKPAYFHKCIGGYHAAKLRRYQELINQHLDREIYNTRQSFKGATSAADIQANFHYNQILNMLNMKYLIYHPESEPIINPFANGNAWFVSTCYVVETPDEEMLKLGTINTKKELVVDKAFSSLIPATINLDSTGYIQLTSYSPNILKYESDATTNQVAVFSEIYYDKGWNAYIDGELTPYFRANYLLRALPIKAGKHKIEFRFEPTSYSIGNTLAGISSILLLLFIGVVIYMEIRKKKETE